MRSPALALLFASLVACAASAAAQPEPSGRLRIIAFGAHPDAAVLVVAPFFTPDAPPLRRNPVILYYSDGFRKPYPFDPTRVVGIDGAAGKKRSCISAMPSQFGDRDSWQAWTRPNVPEAEQERRAFLLESVEQRHAEVADRYRERLLQLYGAERGRRIGYAGPSSSRNTEARPRATSCGSSSPWTPEGEHRSSLAK